MAEQIRQIESGDWVVDLGKKWFRLRANGEVIAKETTWRKGDLCGSVKSRNATDKERNWVKSLVAGHQGASNAKA
jgi:hypothetical protein